MTIKNTLLYAVIAPALAVTLVACSSSDDDGDDGITDAIAGDDDGITDASAGNNAPGNTAPPVLLFDEANDGDIVDDRNNPQPLQLVIGDNRVNGAMVSPDLDYLTVNVPAGSSLTAIELLDYTTVDDRSFMAIQPGSVFTEAADAPNVENLMGYVHFGVDLLGQDLLPALSTGEGAQGFTPPLTDGDYTFWIQETGDELVNYSLIFVVEAN